MSHLRRYIRIALICLQFALSDIFNAVFARLHIVQQYSPPNRLRLLLERLGGTFIKFGQLMAMRPDLLPQEYIDELSSLLDDVPGFDPTAAIGIVEQELHGNIDQLFISFDKTPIAAASFGQVHKAELSSGDHVVVKVQRPNVEPETKADIRLVTALANLVDISGLMRRVKVKPIVAEFRRWTLEELNYIQEATYAERMRQNASDNPCAYIPKVYWNYTTSRVLTLEFIDGIWVSDALKGIESGKALDSRLRGLNRDEVARNIFYNGLHQVFEHDLFHADPHAGNLAILPHNVIGYVDFGIVGQIDEDFRSIQLSLLDALQKKDLDGFARAVVRLLKPPPEDVDLEGFKKEIKENARQWENALYNPRSSLRERSSSSIFAANFLVARNYGLSFSDLAARYYRALGVAELIVLRLDHGFDLRQEMGDFLTKLGIRTLVKQTTPAWVLDRVVNAQLLVRKLPESALGLLRDINYERQIVRSEVSSIRRGLSQLFKGLAAVGTLILFAVPILHFGWPTVYSKLVPFDWRIVCGVVVLLVPFWAWLSRQLYVTSVRPGALIKAPAPW